MSFASLHGMRPVPVCFIAPLKTPSPAQHLASSIDFLKVPCLCLSTSCTRCRLCGKVCCSRCSCSCLVTTISPWRCLSLSKESYLCSSVQWSFVQCLSMPKCVFWESFFLVTGSQSDCKDPNPPYNLLYEMEHIKSLLHP